MQLDREPTVRAKFFGGLLLVFLSPVYLAALIKPSSTLFTIGALLPLTSLIIWCFSSKKYRVGELMTSKIGWVLAFILLVIASATHFLLGASYSASWFVSSFVFFMFTNLFCNILIFLGAYIPPEGETWK